MNIVALLGNVASEPETQVTQSGKTVTKFRLAVSRSNQTEADFFTVVAWEHTAKFCKEHLSIGRRIIVEGRLKHSVWSVEEQSRSRVEVIANQIDLVGAKRKEPEPEVVLA